MYYCIYLFSYDVYMHTLFLFDKGVRYSAELIGLDIRNLCENHDASKNQPSGRT